MNKRMRDYYFDNLKGFLIIAVIIGNTLELANIDSGYIHFFILFLYLFHMPLFTFVTGYFSNKSKRSTNDKVKDTFKLYIYTQVFYTLFNFFILHKQDVKLELLMPQWTLWYLLSMIAWYIISDYIGNKKKWLIGSIILSIFIGFDKSIGTIASLSRTIFFMPFFIAGMMFKAEYINKVKVYKNKILSLGIILLSILYILKEDIPVELFFEYTNYTWYFENPWFPMAMRVFHYIAAVTIGVIVIMYMPKKKTLISMVGKYSLIMYLSHSGISQLLNHFNIIQYTSFTTIVISTLLIIGVVVLFTYIHIKRKQISNRYILDVKSA